MRHFISQTTGISQAKLLSNWSVTYTLSDDFSSMPTHIFVWGYMYPQGLAFGGTS